MTRLASKNDSSSPNKKSKMSTSSISPPIELADADGPNSSSRSSSLAGEPNSEIKSESDDCYIAMPISPDTPPPPFDSSEYDLVEFTLEAKLAMISLLNGAIPELEPIESLDDPSLVPNIYWRLGSLTNFFNLMFDCRSVLFINDLPPISSGPRHMTQLRMDNVNRYLRFWLTQFYYCDDVIGK